MENVLNFAHIVTLLGNRSLLLISKTEFNRKSILIIVQRDITQSSQFIILHVHSTCFGCQPHPPSGVYKTVTTASSTGHNFCAATSLQRGQASLATLEGGTLMMGAVDTRHM